MFQCHGQMKMFLNTICAVVMHHKWPSRNAVRMKRIRVMYWPLNTFFQWLLSLMMTNIWQLWPWVWRMVSVWEINIKNNLKQEEKLLNTLSGYIQDKLKSLPWNKRYLSSTSELFTAIAIINNRVKLLCGLLLN